jgi:protein-S-isoprenylcysteine O-methyltransferase Ste14
MISTLVLIFSFLLVFSITAVIGRSIITKQQIIGRPPIPVFFFILAKMLVVVNLTFLLLKGLNIHVTRVFVPDEFVDLIALAFLIIGTVILFLATFKLNKDLVFGLPSSESHTLQTTGIFSISRHPFYMGFIFILFSSCLFNPHYINILAFTGAWIIHHFIMIKEEQFLVSQYSEEYRQYTKRVRRYISFK